MSQKNKGNLVLTTVIDKNGVKRRVWKSPEEIEELKKQGKIPEDERKEKKEENNLSKLRDELAKKVARKQGAKGEEINLSTKDIKEILTKGKFAIVSAGMNPEKEEHKKFKEEHWKEQHENLISDIAEMGLSYMPTKGKYGEVEESVMVFSPEMNKPEAVELGLKYDQDSIIWGKDGKNEMIYTTGEMKGKAHTGVGFDWVDKEKTDFYTEFINEKGKKVKFNLNFDFENKEDVDMKKAQPTDDDMTDDQRKKVAKVMREFKSGELKSSSGDKVTDREQAVAIAMSEAGITKAKDSDPCWDGYEQVGTKMKDGKKVPNCVQIIKAIEEFDSFIQKGGSEEKKKTPKNGTIKDSTRQGKKAMVWMDGEWHHFGDSDSPHNYSEEARERAKNRHKENLKGDDPRAKAYRVYWKKYWEKGGEVKKKAQTKDIEKSETMSKLKKAFDQLDETFEKGRTKTGTYADNAQNRKLGRVGQKYDKKQVKESSSKKRSGKKDSHYSKTGFEAIQFFLSDGVGADFKRKLKDLSKVDNKVTKKKVNAAIDYANEQSEKRYEKRFGKTYDAFEHTLHKMNKIAKLKFHSLGEINGVALSDKIANAVYEGIVKSPRLRKELGLNKKESIKKSITEQTIEKADGTQVTVFVKM